MNTYLLSGLSESKKGDGGSASAAGATMPIDKTAASAMLLRASSLNISAECLARVRDILGRIVEGKTVSATEIEFVKGVEGNPKCARTTTAFAGIPWWVWLAIAGAAVYMLTEN